MTPNPDSRTVIITEGMNDLLNELTSVIPTCDNCGAVLTTEEHKYYERRCEKCEKAWHERIEEYRNGNDDPELDRRYGVKND